ncbi:MAG: DUF885 domain-containing protein [Ignavibacteria bacterium]|nr:DUF885 domain-containing protein [Ignavibacteria bacterium]
MKFIILILATLSIMSIEQQVIADDNDNLQEIFSEYVEYGKRNYPEGATYDGDHRYDDKVTDNSEAGILARDDSTRNFLAKLTKINYDALSGDNRINYDLFKRSLEESLEFSRFKDYLMPIGQQNGIHLGAPQLVQFQPLSNAEEFNKYFARLRAIGTSVDNDIANMKKGMSLGIVMPSFIMEQTLPQMESIINKNPGESIFFSAMEKGKDLTPEQRESISNELKEIISQDINPAFQRLHDFVKNEYLPVCRQEAGVWSLPDGSDRYNLLVKYFTTLDLTFNDVHQTGLSEVARIEKEMNRIKDSIGFNGSVQEFNEFIKKDPKMFYTDKEDLMNGFRDILGKTDRARAS